MFSKVFQDRKSELFNIRLDSHIPSLDSTIFYARTSKSSIHLSFGGPSANFGEREGERVGAQIGKQFVGLFRCKDIGSRHGSSGSHHASGAVGGVGRTSVETLDGPLDHQLEITDSSFAASICKYMQHYATIA